jgi:hypothetical protein
MAQGLGGLLVLQVEGGRCEVASVVSTVCIRWMSTDTDPCVAILWLECSTACSQASTYSGPLFRGKNRLQRPCSRADGGIFCDESIVAVGSFTV